MNYKILLAFALSTTLVLNANAIVSISSVPELVVENTVIKIKGRKLNTADNPFTASLTTEDGQTVSLNSEVFRKGRRARITLPDIPNNGSQAYKVTLNLSGGNVDATTPQQFVVILNSQPTSFTTNIDPQNNTTQLPEGAESGLFSTQVVEGESGEDGQTGPLGPAGPRGVKGDTGATGPQGPIGLTGATGAQGPIGIGGLTLTAARNYTPDVFFNDTFTNNTSDNFAVNTPALLSVNSGNSGRGWLELTIGSDKVCYKGDAPSISTVSKTFTRNKIIPASNACLTTSPGPKPANSTLTLGAGQNAVLRIHGFSCSSICEYTSVTVPHLTLTKITTP